MRPKSRRYGVCRIKKGVSRKELTRSQIADLAFARRGREAGTSAAATWAPLTARSAVVSRPGFMQGTRWCCPFGHCVTQLGAISLVWCLGGVGAGAAERRARVVPQALLAGQRPWNKSTCDASVSASCVASLNCTIPGASVATKWMGTGRGEQRAEGDRVARRGRVSGAPHGASEPAACAVPAGPPRALNRPTHLKAGTPANQSHTNQGERGAE